MEDSGLLVIFKVLFLKFKRLKKNQKLARTILFLLILLYSLNLTKVERVGNAVKYFWRGKLI